MADRLRDMCRICLLTTQQSSLLKPVTKDLRSKYEEVTQTVMPMTAPYPIKTCQECSDKVTSAFFFMKKLISKQITLRDMIIEKYKLIEVAPPPKTLPAPPESLSDEPVVEEWLEEHLEEDETPTQIIAVEECDSDVEFVAPADQPNKFEFVALPSVRNIPNPKDNGAIVKMIEEIEKKNQRILESTAPKQRHTRRSKYNTAPVKPGPTYPRIPTNLTVRTARKEELVFEQPSPKFIMKPVFPKTVTAKKPAEAVVLSKHFCKKCGRLFPNELALRFHLETHPLDTPIRCCKKIFKTITAFNRHRTTAHKKLFNCSKCEKGFLSPSVRDLHEKTHEEDSATSSAGKEGPLWEKIDDKRLKCPDKACAKKIFPSKQMLDSHIRGHKGQSLVRPVWCNRCTEQFRNTQELNDHLRLRHSKLSCDFCSQEFKYNRDFVLHMLRIHGTKTVMKNPEL